MNAKNLKYPLWGILVILVYYIPYFINGENSYITIHDNLDFDVSAILCSLKEGYGFFKAVNIPMLDGISSSLLDNQLPKLLLYYILPDFYAYMLNDFIVRLIGFMGMYLFLRYYLIKDEKYNLVSLVVALCFGLMSIYTSLGLGCYSLPWLAMSFINLRDKRRTILSYLCIIGCSIYTSFILISAFSGLGLFIYYLHLVYKTKNINKEYLIGLFIMGGIYLIGMYPMIKYMLSPVVCHRVEFKDTISMYDIVRLSLGRLVKTQYHSGSLHVWPILLLELILLLKNKRWNREIIGLNIILALVIGWTFIFHFIKHLCPNIPAIQEFQFDRAYFVLPFIWMCIFALVTVSFLKDTSRKSFNGCVSVTYIVFIFCTFGFNEELRNNWRIMLGIYDNSSPTYAQYYDRPLFEEISNKLHIDKQNEKVACVGLQPTIPLYNHFQTVDGYDTLYPLEYKYKFRKIIASELQKNKALLSYYDDWGHRCYIFSTEIRGSREAKDNISNLSIDTEAFKDLGGRYLFSSVFIDNYESLNLDFVGEFTTPNSFWKIKAYRVRG
jgi:hypothetical protein